MNYKVMKMNKVSSRSLYYVTMCMCSNDGGAILIKQFSKVYFSSSPQNDKTSMLIYTHPHKYQRKTEMAIIWLSAHLFVSCCLITFMHYYHPMSAGVTDGRVVRAVVSVTCSVLSRSGGHEFELQSCRTWCAWYSCPSHTLTKKGKCV